MAAVIKEGCLEEAVSKHSLESYTKTDVTT